MERKFLRPKELAELLGVDRLTVYSWLRKKRIPCLRVGKSVFIPRDILEPPVQEPHQGQ